MNLVDEFLKAIENFIEEKGRFDCYFNNLSDVEEHVCRCAGIAFEKYLDKQRYLD